MSSRTDITPLSITNGKISNQAKIDPRKLAPAKEGQVLIAGKDGKFLAGDLPTTTVTNTVTTEEEVLPPNQIKIGPNTAEPGATNQFVNVGAGEHSIPRRDSSGNLKAETADRATNADQATTATNADNATLLNGNNMEYYRNVANHNYGSSTNLTTDDGGIAGTSTPKLHKIVTATNSGQSSPTQYTVEHDLGYQPQVTVLADTEDNGDYYEIDAEVKSETDKVTVKVSTQSVPLKIICS